MSLALAAEAEFYCLRGLAKRLERMRGTSLQERSASAQGLEPFWGPDREKFLTETELAK